MKYLYVINIALIAIVAIAGFAAADRLPRQVPENQVFTIDTIIDATGQVSDSSSMQWVLDDQKLAYHALDRSNTNGDDFVLTTAQVASLTAAGCKVITDSDGTILEILIPDSLLYASDDYAHTLPANLIDPANDLISYDDLYNYLFALGQYSASAKTDEGQIHDSKLNPTETIMLMTWSDELRSNGGKIALNKNIDFDSKNKVAGMSNLQVEKVLTYAKH